MSNESKSSVRDYPELQVGYPERNDVRSPEYVRERIHVDLESLKLIRASENELKAHMRGSSVSEFH